jgi:hypothetical protein
MPDVPRTGYCVAVGAFTNLPDVNLNTSAMIAVMSIMLTR